MAVTRAGQMVCRANWNNFAGTSDLPVKWSVDENNGFGGQVRFDEYALRNYDYYKSYVDDLGRSYYDIRFYLEGFGETPSPLANLSKVSSSSDEESETKDYYINNGDIYCAKFQVLQNNKYHQNFSLVLYNSKTGNDLAVRSFKIPAKTQADEIEIYFCPESFGSSEDYDQIILKVDRNDESSMNVIMELAYFDLYKLNNLLETMTDENGDAIEELLGVSFETVNRGECLFFVDFDTFYIGNDRVLNIDEDLEVSIKKLAYIKHIPRTNVHYNSSDYITCLVNYKY